MAARSALRSEVLQFYREVLRTTRVFSGQLDPSKRDTATMLATSARKEIEGTRDIESSEEIYRRLVVGREALYQIHDMVSTHVSKRTVPNRSMLT